ncbi:MAG: insulinase family protein, partial [Candidatus Krumholzibacteria bacterium]|nr:insulinase family protein [Candidatus Krumholzibacteria bacterium]
MRTLALTLILSLIMFNVGCQKKTERTVLLPVADDPTVSFRVMFKIGSQNDPPGKEGLAALTATLITEGSTKTHSYEEILELLYPMASSIAEQVDKEMTVFSGRTHLDNLDDYYALFKEVLLEPAFAEDDFTRVKSDYLNYIRTTLRYSQDEELGKEALYEFIFAGTPYEHNEEGHVASLSSITVQDVREFYEAHYAQNNMIIGLGGGFDSGFAKQVSADFEALPMEKVAEVPMP